MAMIPLCSHTKPEVPKTCTFFCGYVVHDAIAIGP
jgi:hypothetical protein